MARLNHSPKVWSQATNDAMLDKGELSFPPSPGRFRMSQGIRMLLSGMWLASPASLQLAAPPGEWRVVWRGPGGTGGWAAEPRECRHFCWAEPPGGLAGGWALSPAGAEPVAAALAAGGSGVGTPVPSSPWLRGVQQVRAPASSGLNDCC